MVNDGRAAGQAAIHGAALHALAGIGHGFLVGTARNGHAFQAHGVAGGVHHDEHVFQATVFFAHQVAHRAAVVAKLQHGRGAALDAQLVLDAHAMHVIALAQAAVGVHQELGHDEQADAFDAFGRIRQACQHEVHEVFRHVVLAVGDEDLGAEHFVGAIGLALGAAADQRQIAAGLRLGQVHRACPLAGDEFFQIGALELFAARNQQRLDGAVGQHRAQGKAHVGRVQDFGARGGDGFGQALAAIGFGVLHALPAAFGELAVSLFETGGGGHLAIGEGGGLLVAGHVQRRDHAFIELGALFQHGLGGFQPGLLKTGQLGNLVDAGQMLDVEQQILDGSLKAHGCLLKVREKRLCAGRKGHCECKSGRGRFDDLRAFGRPLARAERLSKSCP